MKRQTIELASQLIQINSVTPNGHSQYARQGGEARIVDWLCEYLQKFSFHVEKIYVKPNRPNLLVKSSQFDRTLPTISFSSHLDTVDVEGMDINPFSGELRDGCLWGRGACDVKSTLAVMLTLLINWHHKNTKPKFNLIFIGTMGEESGTLGSKHLAGQQLDMDMVLVGEPTLLNPVVAHKGLWRFAIETFGKSCHSSRPEYGVNAIEIMIRIINNLSEKIKPVFEKSGENTFAMTTLHGGSLVNIIPDICKLEVDARFSDDSIVTHSIKQVKAFLSDNENAKFIEYQLEPSFHVKPDSILLELLEQAILQNGLKYNNLSEPWYSDAAQFSAAGYDTVLWGAGDIRNAHTRDEHISVEQINRAEQILSTFLSCCENYYGNEL